MNSANKKVFVQRRYDPTRRGPSRIRESDRPTRQKREGPPLAERPFHCRDQAEIAYGLDVTASAMRENPAHGQWSRSYDPRMAIDNETQDHLLSVVDDASRIR